MRDYEFQFFDAAGGRPTFDFSHCLDDAEAAREALAQLGRHETCQGVEIYDGERLVAKLERPTPQAVLAASSPVPHG